MNKREAIYINSKIFYDTHTHQVSDGPHNIRNNNIYLEKNYVGFCYSDQLRKPQPPSHESMIRELQQLATTT